MTIVDCQQQITDTPKIKILFETLSFSVDKDNSFAAKRISITSSLTSTQTTQILASNLAYTVNYFSREKVESLAVSQVKLALPLLNDVTASYLTSAQINATGAYFFRIGSAGLSGLTSDQLNSIALTAWPKLSFEQAQFILSKFDAQNNVLSITDSINALSKAVFQKLSGDFLVKYANVLRKTSISFLTSSQLALVIDSFDSDHLTIIPNASLGLAINSLSPEKLFLLTDPQKISVLNKLDANHVQYLSVDFLKLNVNRLDAAHIGYLSQNQVYELINYFNKIKTSALTADQYTLETIRSISKTHLAMFSGASLALVIDSLLPSQFSLLSTAQLLSVLNNMSASSVGLLSVAFLKKNINKLDATHIAYLSQAQLAATVNYTTKENFEMFSTDQLGLVKANLDATHLNYLSSKKSGAFSAFEDLIRNFESGIDPSKLADYKKDYNNKVLNYVDVEIIDGITYPKVDANGAYVYKPMSYKEYFETLRVGQYFDPITATTADVQKMQYASINPWNFVGYQVGEAALISAGYYAPPVDAATGYKMYYIYAPDAVWHSGQTSQVYKPSWSNESMILLRSNVWQGIFTGKDGVNSLADLKTKEKQELVIQAVWQSNYDYITKQITTAGKTWTEALNQSWTMSNGVVVKASMSGLMAAAHLTGSQSVVALLLSGVFASDETGTGILTYVNMFGGKEIPWGSNGSENLDGSVYSNIFDTGNGSHVITTYAGSDTIILRAGSKVTTITDFTVGADILVLKDQSKETPEITSSGSDAVLTFKNGNQVILKGVSAQIITPQLSSVLKFSNNYQMSWNGAIEANKVLSGFDYAYDKLVAPNGASLSSLLVSDVRTSDGSTAIEITFAYDNSGWVGSGYILTGITKAEFIAKASSIFSGASGLASDIKVNPNVITLPGTVVEPPLVEPPVITPTIIRQFTMSWDGSIEKNQIISGFDYRTDRLVGASGSSYSNLYITDVTASDGTTGAELTFAYDGQGWIGGGYFLAGVKSSDVIGNIKSVVSNVAGDPTTVIASNVNRNVSAFIQTLSSSLISPAIVSVSDASKPHVDAILIAAS